MVKRIVNANVVTPDRVLENASVSVEDGVIADVTERPVKPKASDIDLGGAYLFPGFIDIHTHTKERVTADDCEEKIAEISRQLISIGTTGFLWSMGNSSIDVLFEVSRAVRDALADPPTPCACLGLHFEGPYIAPAAKGGFQPDVPTTPAELPPEELLEAGGKALKYLTLSPEVPGAMDVIRLCRRRGIAVGLGHTLADVDTLQAAYDLGARGVCHTYCATPHVPYIEPGVRGITVDEFGISTDMLNELICDGTHVHPILVRLLWKAKRPHGVAIVTDSIFAGRPVPEGHTFVSGSKRRTIRNRVARTEDGMLVGTAATMEWCLRKFEEFTGAGLPELSRVTALNAARFLGMDGERGAIAPGMKAEFAALDADLRPCMDRLESL